MELKSIGGKELKQEVNTISNVLFVMAWLAIAGGIISGLFGAIVVGFPLLINIVYGAIIGIFLMGFSEIIKLLQDQKNIKIAILKELREKGE